MRMNVVFNLDSVEELKKLTEALGDVIPLQAKVVLENEIKSLIERKKTLKANIKQLREERDGLTDKTKKSSLRDVNKEIEVNDAPPEPTTLVEDQNSPSALRPESERLIQTITNEQTQEDGELE